MSALLAFLLILGSSYGYSILPAEEIFNLGRAPLTENVEEYNPFDGPENIPFEGSQQPSEEARFFEDELRIPGEQPHKNDTYLCSAFRQDAQSFVVGFDPLVDKHNVHHVLLFGCEAPGVRIPVATWNCGEMASGIDEDFVQAPPCAGEPHIIYAWAKGAPKLDLPKDVAFPVGMGTRNRVLVLQVHYMHGVEEADFSGVKIKYTDTPQPRTAATLLLVTGGQTEPHKIESFEAACALDEDIEIHPFAFRVHTHKHGKDVSGWVVNEDPSTQQDEWHLIGQRDPQKEQLFETVANKSLVIRQNDVVASRCIIENNEDKVLTMGPTGADEMCNFYMMYWVEGERTLAESTCYSPGAPSYHWTSEAGLNNLPQ